MARMILDAVPAPATEHPMRCDATLDFGGLHVHACIHPVRKSDQIEGTPEHLCHCGAKWWQPALGPSVGQQLALLRGQVVTLLGLCDGLKRFEGYDPVNANVTVRAIEEIFEGFDRGNAHVAECEGGHTREISCAEVTKARDEAVADLWWCRVSGAYHMWDVPTPQRTPEAVCAHGCGQVWSELAADLAAAEGTGTPEVDRG